MDEVGTSPHERPPRDSTTHGAPTAAGLISTTAGLMFVVAAAAILLGSAAVRERRARESTCRHSLLNVGYGLANYCETYGRFPPPYVLDDRGRRAHSWRILALPTFEHQYRHPSLYSYTHPWDSPWNAGLAADVPGLLACPAERAGNPGGSPFVMLNDLSGADPRAIPGDAILAVEWWGANRSWLDPNDRVVLGPVPRVPATDHAEGFGVVLRDFTVERVRDPSRIVRVGGYYVLKGHRREPK